MPADTSAGSIGAPQQCTSKPFRTPEGRLRYERPSPGVCRDRSDDAILACAAAAHAEFLVTGDDDLIELRTFQKIRIIRPHGLEALFDD
jgi:hypothetical protein